MKKDRNILEKRLSDICLNITVDTMKCNEIYDLLKEKYDIPRGISSDLICFRKSMSEITEFILFCMLDIFNETLNAKINISDFYTDQEIKKYSKSKYKVNKIKFPLIFKMVQVSEDQWLMS